MRVFIIILKIVKYMGFIVFLFMISALITSLVYFNHKVYDQNKIQDVQIYFEETVDTFLAYGDKQLFIDVEFKEEKSSNYLMMYAYYYFDIYQKELQMCDFSNQIIITINKEGLLTLSKLEN